MSQVRFAATEFSPGAADPGCRGEKESGSASVQQLVSMPVDLRQRLIEYYEPDIACVENLLQKDLSAWRADQPVSGNLD